MYNLRSLLSFFKIKISKTHKILRPIRGLRNIVSIKGIVINTKFDVIGNENEILFIKGSHLFKTKVYIRGNNNKIFIDEGALIKNTSLVIESDFNDIYIGKKTTIEGAHLGVAENNKSIFINDNCMLSENIYIMTTDSHSILSKETGERINPPKNVYIDKNVWVGRNVTILKGVKIGCNAIIASNSVVSKDVVSDSLNAGIPSKLIKENVYWLREKI